MSALHYTEAFTPDGEDYWGFQCFTCGYEATGYEDLLSAESAADQHIKEAMVA